MNRVKSWLSSRTVGICNSTIFSILSIKSYSRWGLILEGKKKNSEQSNMQVNPYSYGSMRIKKTITNFSWLPS